MKELLFRQIQRYSLDDNSLGSQVLVVPWWVDQQHWRIVSKKFLLSIGIAVSLFTVAACGDSSEDNGGDAAAPSAESSEQAQGAPEPDLEGIPDVVAVVNGEEIGKDEFVTTYEGRFQQQAMQSQGQEIDQQQLKEQTAQGMVDNEILVQEAGNRGLEATQKEIDKTLSDLAQQNGMGSPDEFLTAIEEQQGMKKDEIMSQLEMQVKVDELIAEEAGNTEPTEKELKEIYDQAVAQGGDQSQIPPFEEVKPQLVEQARAEKESAAAQKLVTDLREKADITVNL